VVDARGVQSHLRAESAEPTKQAVGVPLWGGQSHLQDPEAGMIHTHSLSLSLSLRKFFILTSL
jgi:hypothetical protein